MSKRKQPTQRNVTPKAAALAVLAAMRDQISRIESEVARRADGEDSAPLGLSNEYMTRVMRAGDGLAVHGWSTYSTEEQPEPTVAADSASMLAMQMMDMIWRDAVQRASFALVEAGYHHN